MPPWASQGATMILEARNRAGYVFAYASVDDARSFWRTALAWLGADVPSITIKRGEI